MGNKGCYEIKENGYYGSIKPPSHSHKDYKDRTAFLKLEKHWENGMKCSKFSS